MRSETGANKLEIIKHRLTLYLDSNLSQLYDQV
jgi:hypothetical protein